MVSFCMPLFWYCPSGLGDEGNGFAGRVVKVAFFGESIVARRDLLFWVSVAVVLSWFKVMFAGV